MLNGAFALYLSDKKVESTTGVVQLCATKTEKALLTSENVLEGIECGTIATSSALLQCLRIARLLNDSEAVKWFQYEYGGYPKDLNGLVLNEAWTVACQHGRSFVKDGKVSIFVSLASELEAKIESR